MVEQRIIDVVFRGMKRPRRWHIVIATALAIVLHTSLVGSMFGHRPSLETWTAEIAARVHQELLKQETVSIERLPPQPAEPPAKPPPSKGPSVESKPHAAAVHAQAAQVVAQEPDAPADFGDEAIVTGNASSYAGGATTAKGKSAKAVDQVVQRKTETEDLSAPVGLDPEQWNCAWPAQAAAAEIDEQSIIIRVLVREDGSVAEAAVDRDPGLGFADAALACAKNTRFNPAHDKLGRPIAAKSAPIRVRFTR